MTALGKKFYLTKLGLGRFTDEFEKLRDLRMERVKEDENHDELAIINKRLEDIAQVLQSYELISVPPKDKRNVVSLGATVSVQSSDGQVNDLTIVGTLEANPPHGIISNESPVGKALLGKRVGDKVLVHANSRVSYEVRVVTYGRLGKVRRA